LIRLPLEVAVVAAELRYLDDRREMNPPAMEAKIADHVWSLEEIAALADSHHSRVARDLILNLDRGGDVAGSRRTPNLISRLAATGLL
jgi:hypothetical protein